MDVNVELIVYILADGVAQTDDFVGGGTTEIDEHQCLFVMHSCPTE